MTERTRRIQRLRRRVAVGATVTFAAAFGTVAANGSMGTATTSTATTVTEDASATTTQTQTQVAEAPSSATTRQS